MDFCGTPEHIMKLALQAAIVITVAFIVIGVGLMLIDRQAEAGEACMATYNCSVTNATCCMTLLSDTIALAAIG